MPEHSCYFYIELQDLTLEYIICCKSLDDIHNGKKT